MVTLLVFGVLPPWTSSAEADSYRRRRGKAAKARGASGGYRRRRGGGKPAVPPPPPYLLLARRAVLAGKLATAERRLAAARGCWKQRGRRCGFARWGYQLVAGIVYLERGQPLRAARALRASLAAKAGQPTAWLYLGQALFRAERYRHAAKALRRARGVGDKKVDYHLLLSRALERSGQAENARVALVAALARFPKEARLLRELASLYAARGLYLTASRVLRRLWHQSRGGARRRLALMLADYLRRGAKQREALAILERTRLAHPRDSEVLSRLAYTYADAGQPLAAARLASRAVAASPRLAFFVAEQYRLAGDFARALRWNGRVGGGARRAHQRATIFLAAGAWHRAATTLGELLGRGKLGARGRYRLGYAALKSRRLGLARRALQGAGASSSVRRLRSALAACAKDSADCP